MPKLVHKQDTRVEKFLKYYGESNNVRQSALKAGYKDSYASKQGYRIVERALKYQINRALEVIESKDKTTLEVKDALASLIGYNSEDIGEQFKKIVEQDRDYSSKLKALTPLLKEQGINIQDTEDTKTIVPIMNITVRNDPQRIVHTQVDEGDIVDV